METFIVKKNTGHSATTTTQLDGTKLFFRIATNKSYNGELRTTATCFQRDGMFEKHRVYQDYYRVCVTVKTRVTEKAVINQHNSIKENIAYFIEDAKQYYNSPEYIAKYGNDA